MQTIAIAALLFAGSMIDAVDYGDRGRSRQTPSNADCAPYFALMSRTEVPRQTNEVREKRRVQDRVQRVPRTNVPRRQNCFRLANG